MYVRTVPFRTDQEQTHNEPKKLMTTKGAYITQTMLRIPEDAHEARNRQKKHARKKAKMVVHK